LEQRRDVRVLDPCREKEGVPVDEDELLGAESVTGKRPIGVLTECASPRVIPSARVEEGASASGIGLLLGQPDLVLERQLTRDVVG
jgi:hypothetical protein